MGRNVKKRGSKVSSKVSTRTEADPAGDTRGDDGGGGEHLAKAADSIQQGSRRRTGKRSDSPSDLQEEISKVKKKEKLEDKNKNNKTTTRRKRITSSALDSQRSVSKKKKIEQNINESEKTINVKKTPKRKADDRDGGEKEENAIANKGRKRNQKKRQTNVRERTHDEENEQTDAKTDNDEKEAKEKESSMKLEGSSDESDDDDWEEVEELNVIQSPVKMMAPDQTIEITLDTPNQTKKKNKEELWEDYFRREINRYNKEQQITIHKAHLLCLLSVGRYRANACSTNTMQALCLSVIPNKFTKIDNLDISFLIRFVRWFQSQFKVNSTITDSNSKPFDEVLCSRFERFEVANETELVYIFASLLTCIQVCVRIIFSLQPVPLKSTKIIKKTNQKSPKDGGTRTKDSKKSKNKRQEKSKIDNTGKEQKATVSLRKTRTKNLSRRKNASKVIGKGQSSTEVDDESIGDLDSDEEWIETQKRSQTNSSSSNMDSDSDFEPEVMNISKRQKSSGKKKSKVSKVAFSDSEEIEIIGEVKNQSLLGSDVWIEVFHESDKKWICIDCIRGIINHPEKCESYATQPMLYVLSFSKDGSIKDLTKKYASKWMTHARKLRIDHMEPKWWQATLKPFRTKDEDGEEAEDQQLQENLMNKPMPTSVAEFKNHPLYALKRHLLKFEAIYPESATILGYCRGEAIYSRDCVHELHAKEAWIKEARVVRIGEKPYKVVKARPKPHQRKTGELPPPLPIYGYWQTEEYMAPPAVDGKVPRNEHGNVELYKPCMLPVGTVHLKIPGLNKVARKLDIDCAPAMVGWDFHCGYSHPVFDGFIVCEEFQEPLLDAWQQEQLEIEKKNNEKRELRVIKNWRKLIKGLLIRERLNRRFQSSYEGSDLPANKNENADDVNMAWPLNRNLQKSDDNKHLFPFEKL